MREAAYGLLTEDDRALGHRLAARFLEKQGGRDALVIAEHFQQGGEPGAAIRHYLRAAERALEGSDLLLALRLADRGVRCGATGAELGSLRAVQLAAHFWRDGWSDSLPVGREALKLLPVGSADWCKAAAVMLPISSLTGELALFGAITEQLATVEPQDDARPDCLRASSYVVVMYSLLGQKQAAQHFLRFTERIGAALDQKDAAAQGFFRFAQTIYLRSFERDVWANWSAAREGSLLSEQAGDFRNVLFIKAFWGIGLCEIGDYEGAETVLSENLALAHKLQEPLLITHASVMREQLLLTAAGTPEIAKLASAQQVVQQGINPLLRGQAMGNLARASMLAHNYPEAEQVARRSMAALQHTPLYWLFVATTLIESLLLQKRATEACEVAAEGLALIERLGCAGYAEVAFRLGSALAYDAVADRERARRELARTVQEIELRAAHIPTEEARQRFLRDIPEHAHAAELARSWGQEGELS